MANDSVSQTMGARLRNIGMSMRGDFSRNDVTPKRMDISNSDASPMRNDNGTSMMKDTSGNYRTTDTNISRNFSSLMSDDTLRNNGRRMRDDTSKISPTHQNKTVNHSNTFKRCVGKVQSAGNKITTIANYTHEHDIDMYLIVELWLPEIEHRKKGDLKQDDYEIKYMPRDSRKGGGMICLYKKELCVVKMEPPFAIRTMECMEIMMTVWSKKVRLVNIYCPEPSENNRYTMGDFYKEFSKLMSHYNTIKDRVIICRDFNIHVNKTEDPDSKKLMAVLSRFNLTQHVNEPTHRLGNTLDLIITRKRSIILNHHVDFQISDQNNIIFQIDMQKPACPKKSSNSES